MKLYSFYLTLPDNDSIFEKIEDSEAIEEFKEVQFLNNLQKTYNQTTDSWTYLYAYTTDKDLAKMFYGFVDHELFVMTKKKITEKDYYDLKRLSSVAELTKFYFLENLGRPNNINATQKDIDELYIPVTINDMNDNGYIFEQWLEQVLMDSACEIPYDIFQRKYQVILDILKATYYRDLCIDEEAALDLRSYSCTPLGYGNSMPNFPHMFNIYCRLYRLILQKKNKEKIEDDDL